MRVHLELLGRLHVAWGALGVLTGASLGVLATGAALSLRELGSAGALTDPAVWVLGGAGLVLSVGGLAILWTGHALLGRRSRGRYVALSLAVPNAVLVPIGTALGVYTFWTLLNDDARRAFGRPPRADATTTGTIE